MRGKTRQYALNERFFDNLSPPSCWLLGWLMSDGFVARDGRCFGLKLAVRDRQILEAMKQLLGYTGPILQATRHLEVTGKVYEQVLLKLSSAQIVRRLLTFGIGPAKSTREFFPAEILASGEEELLRRFVQGLYEGDGSILVSANGSVCFQLVGTKELLMVVQRLLMGYAALSATKLTPNTLPGKNHYALRYRGRRQCRRIFDWIYLNSAPLCRLDRKYRVYRSIQWQD
jgi:hypothetical protein